MNSSRSSKQPKRAMAQRTAGKHSTRHGREQGGRLAAYVQPRMLLAAMLLMLIGSVLWAVAQNKGTSAKPTASKPAAIKPAVPAKGGKKIDRWSELPAMMRAYAQRRAQAARGAIAANAKESKASPANVTTKRFALTEVDLTPGLRAFQVPTPNPTPLPGSSSEDRMPAYRPEGNIIAFVSDGVDSNGDGRIDGRNATGKFHIWLMNRDGSQQRQITGRVLSGPARDDDHDQFFPAWSPDGTRLVYTDVGVFRTNFDAQFTNGTSPKTELLILNPILTDLTGQNQPAPVRITFSGGDKRRPTWSPSGQNIAFATNTNPRRNQTIAPPAFPYDTLFVPGTNNTRAQFDIFSISNTGVEDTIVRLTGGTGNNPVGGDPSQDIAGQYVDDLNPAYARINQNVIYFSSDRNPNFDPAVAPDAGANNPSLNAVPVATNGPMGLPVGQRRIWLMQAANGSGKARISDPRVRTGFRAGDVVADDMPTASLENNIPPNNSSNILRETVAFQSNSRIDASDETQDFNIWSLQVSTPNYAPAPTPTPTLIPALYVNSFTSQANPPNPAHTEAFQAYDNIPTPGRSAGAPLTIFGSVLNPTNIVVTGLDRPEDVKFGPDGKLYIANRGQNRIERYDPYTGTPLPAPNQIGANFATNMPAPTGMAFDQFGNLLVGSADNDNNQGGDNKIHRFYGPFGGPSGQAPGTPNPAPGQGGSIFSNGPDGVDAGIEGITFGSNANDPAANDTDPFGPDIYAAAFGNDKVTVYDGDTGLYIRDFVAAGTAGLDGPTGIAFGSDQDVPTDGIPDLYVASSLTNQVKVYRVNRVGSRNDTATTFDPVIPNSTFVNGASSNLINPERIAFGPDYNNDGFQELFVTNFSGEGAPGVSGSGQGTTVKFYDGDTGAPMRGTGDFNLGGSLRGPSGLDFTPGILTARTPVATPVPVVPPTVERQFVQQARLETNRISSPAAFAASGLQDANGPNNSPNAEEDKVNDVEPTYSLATGTAQETAVLAFASQRRTAPTPGNTIRPDGTVDPNPIIVNPDGGINGKYDIWTTSTDDFTPPILTAQGSGNQRVPLIAPGPQAPFPAPRTAETGLAPNSQTLRIALVLQDIESGVRSVQAVARQADAYEFIDPRQFPITPVNDTIPVQISQRENPQIRNPGALTAVAVYSNFQIYDDGPPRTDRNGNAIGHELQSGAVAGDGTFFCEGTFTTPAQPGDYYLDIIATDNAFNSFNYDNVWGFSTVRFVSNPTTYTDMLVADYTEGQQFPFILGGDPRFAGANPIENYLLTDPGGDVVGNTTTPATILASSDKTTFKNVSVWRILARGPVPLDILNNYRPQPDLQIDPADVRPNGTPVPQLPRNRPVAIANAGVIWSSPYTGIIFSGPGTIMDTQTQDNLTAFLEAGGRLTVTGKDVIFGITNQGQASSAFLANELQASWSGELGTISSGQFNGGILAAAQPGGRWTYYPELVGLGLNQYRADDDNLQFPPKLDDLPNNTWRDASTNQNLNRGMDIIGSGPGGANVTVTPSYVVNGSRVGQRVVRTRANGLRSQVGFLSFGIEGVNRRYHRDPDDNRPWPQNVRPALADGIQKWMKTGSISGRVIDDRTQLPIANFLVEINGWDGQTYFARTDTNGNYQVFGLTLETFTVNVPPQYGGGFNSLTLSTYSVRPAVYPGTNTQVNQGYANINPRGVGLFGPEPVTDFNLRVIPSPPGGLTGVAKQSNGTFNDRTDDTPIANLPVLVRSRQSLPAANPNNPPGRYAQLTRTNAAGQFTFAEVPTNADLEVVFNPRLDDPTTPNVDENDIPQESGLRPIYVLPVAQGGLYGGPRPDVGRRVLPDPQRPVTILPDASAPGGTRRLVLGETPTALEAPIGQTFFLNDGPQDDTVADDSTASAPRHIVVPLGSSITGRVVVNGQPVGGAIVTLLNSDRSPLPPLPLGRQTVTQANGVYSFQDIAPGTYIVTARYSRGTSPSAVLTGEVTVTVRQFQDALAPDIELFQQDITGFVQLDDGTPGTPRPAVGFIVSLLSTGSSTPIAQTTTDNNGRYNFFNVALGTYIIQAQNPAGNLIKQSAPFTLTRFNAGPPPSGGDVTVPPIVFVVRSVTGVVLLNNSPVANATVELFNVNGVKVATTTTNSQGQYVFAVVSQGSYSLRASAFGDVSPQVPFAVNQANVVVNLDLFLETIVGRVLLNGTPVGGAAVQLIQNGRVVANATTNSTGNYSFPDVPAGDYQVRAELFGDSDQRFVRVLRASRNAQGVIQGLTVTAPDLTLVTQSISGRVVLNGLPVAGATVQLFNEVLGGQLVAATSTASDGTYFFGNLPPGTYRLRATAQGDSVEARVTITRGNSVSGLELSLLLETISGRITLNGVPTAGAKVELLQGDVVRRTFTTLADGNYSFAGLLPGTYQVRASKGGDAASTTVSISRGINATANLDLKLQTIRGRVLLNGRATRGITVELLRSGRVQTRVLTDANGNYSFGNLPVGTFAVRAVFKGDSTSTTVRVTRAVDVRVADLQLRLQTVSGRVLLNNRPVSGATVVLVQNGRNLQTKTTDSLGAYSFSDVSAGVYIVRASRSGDTAQLTVTVARGANLRVPDIQLRLQTASGQVLLNGTPARDAVVLLLREDGSTVTRATTGADGRFSFANLPAGVYTVRALLRGATTEVDINMVRGRDLTVPTLRLTIAVPTPTPGAEPTPTPAPGTGEFVVGQTYQISIPFADSEAATATTTPAKAFTVAPRTGTVVNYRLFRFNARTQVYEELTNNSAIRRGEGFFLRPETSDVSLRRPANDATRKPMSATSFTITLRSNPSLASNDPRNGFNLIGSPFDPNIFQGADFLNSQVILPNGRTFNTVNEAVAAGVMTGALFTLNENTGEYQVVRENLSNFKGYYVRTFVDGLRIVLKPNSNG